MSGPSLRARVEALANQLAAFNIDHDPVPSHIDVPDDYEQGIHDAAGQLRRLLEDAD